MGKMVLETSKVVDGEMRSLAEDLNHWVKLVGTGMLEWENNNNNQFIL